MSTRTEANCGRVLGALLIAARSLRLSRIPAAGQALTGLAMFMVLVGPDASVLRAALMGSIAVASLASLAGGRMGRGLSFLCLAVMGLLLIDPGLGTSFGFLLSVLATLGIIVLGRRMIDWIGVEALGTAPGATLARSAPEQHGAGLVAAAHRGRLRHCTSISGRNPLWPQPRPHEPGLRRPTRPPGGT